VARRIVRAVPRVRFLAPFVDVRRGELLAMLCSTLWIFCALAAYYVVKPIRGTMLQTRIGVDHKPIAILATAAFVGVFAWAYGRTVRRVGRARLVLTTYGVFLACLVVFALVLARGGTLAGYAFYVWVSTFNVLVVSQFWSLAADVWSKEEGARLFGFIGVGAVAGGIFGAEFVAESAKRVAIPALLLIAAAVLGLCMLLSLVVLRFGRGRDGAPPAPEASVDAFRLVLSSPYLRLVAVMTLCLNLVNSNDEWILDKVLSRAGLAEADVTVFYARFHLAQNVLTLLIQLFLTTRVRRRFGALGALLVLPAVALGGGLAFWVVPSLFVIRWMKVAENATDYSIQSNTREVLYLPLLPIEKYAAKAVNETFVVRVGDLFAAGAIWVAASILLPELGDRGLAVLVAFDVVLCVVWIAAVLRVGRFHRAAMT
jgi:AAA family ATP:ADP antiporter